MTHRLAYGWHWLTFKLAEGLKPWVGITPIPRSVRWRIERTRFGLIIWGGGKRRHYSWRLWCEGPCNYATYRWLRGGDVVS